MRKVDRIDSQQYSSLYWSKLYFSECQNTDWRHYSVIVQKIIQKILKNQTNRQGDTPYNKGHAETFYDDKRVLH